MQPPPPDPEAATKGFLDKLGMPPLGSYQYATSVAEFGLAFGNWPGTGGFGTGFHYTERGGLFASVILAVLGSAAEKQAAQERANRTGTTQYYRTYSPSDFPRTGMTIDAMSTQLGGSISGVNVDLFSSIKFREDSELPFLIDIGMNLHYFDGPDETTTDPMTMNETTDGHGVGGLGLIIGGLFPVTRWAQAEIKVRPVLPASDNAKHKSWITAEAVGTFNVGNRLYARASFVLSQQSETGMLFGLGGRL